MVSKSKHMFPNGFPIKTNGFPMFPNVSQWFHNKTHGFPIFPMFWEVCRSTRAKPPKTSQNIGNIVKPFVLFGKHWETFGKHWETIGFDWGTIRKHVF